MKNKLLRPMFWISGAVLALGLGYAAFLFLAFRIMPAESASVGIIGGADGPTAIFITSRLVPDLLLPALFFAAAAGIFAYSGITLLRRRNK